jgi:hypothetical protein
LSHIGVHHTLCSETMVELRFFFDSEGSQIASAWTLLTDSADQSAPCLLSVRLLLLGEGCSRTYDEYGIGSIDGEGNAADNGISLHRTMV